MSAPLGTFQQMLGGKTAQMLRVRLDAGMQCVPEISANKYVLNIRFLAQNGDDAAEDRRLGRRFELTFATKVTVPCRHCGKPAALAPENPWRPFCSERCKTIDLGAWASESIASPTAPPDRTKAEIRSAVRAQVPCDTPARQCLDGDIDTGYAACALQPARARARARLRG
jgi:endogenous inhibitor of DNA gyrase (YacG/DUF329 family)